MNSSRFSIFCNSSISNVIRLSVQMCSPSNVDIFNLDIGNGNKNQKTPKDFKVLK
jgi:hypothetical protein